jgi:hypothetical protein
VRTVESIEKKEIDTYLKSLSPACYYVTPTTGGFGASGHSDRIVCIKGWFLAIEVKREGKEPTALQWKRLKEVEAAGGKGIWGTSAKVIPEIKAWILNLP